MNPNPFSNFFHFLAHRVIGIVPGLCQGMRQQSMILIYGCPACQAYGGGLDASGKTHEMVRLDITEDNAQACLHETPVDEDRCPTRRDTQVNQVNRVCVMRKNRIAPDYF